MNNIIALMLMFVVPVFFGRAQFNFELVKNINTSGHSSPSGFTEYKGLLYFQADDGENGTELWVTDGTEESTVLFKNLNPFSDGDPVYFCINDSVLFFRATYGATGRELWKSDGTEEGTVLVKDIRPGTSSSSPNKLISIGDVLYFSANNGEVGTELWVSEGTDESTNLLKDIKEGWTDSSPFDFIEFDDRLFFIANDGEHGIEPWVSDGTVAGTVMLKDIKEGASGSSMLLDRFAVYGDKLFFSADDGTYHNELWCSDGTSDGTVLLKDINPEAHGNPAGFTIYNELLYFRAQTSENGYELWVTDGTEEGTQMVVEINPGGGFSGSSTPQFMTVFDGKLYFNAKHADHGSELWVTDGTPEGTEIVKDIDPGTSSGFPTHLTVYNDRLFFIADDGTNGKELWMTDGTSEGTMKLTPEDATGDSPLFDTEELILFEDGLYLSANYNDLGRELWKIAPAGSSDVGIHEIPSSEKFSIYPNPVSNMLNIEINTDVIEVSIINVFGKTVYTQESITPIDVSLLETGVYFVQVKSITGTRVKKFIKH